ncbi:MAG: RrF2 family transcriptional regulator [Alkaliphilus sp.]
MKLSTKGRYGLKAMYELAAHFDEGLITIKYIAEKQKIPENYLEQLLSTLRKAKMVESIRGARGGYKLFCNPEKISVGDILRTLEGPIKLSECIMDTEHDSCDNDGNCSTQVVWRKIKNSITNVIDTITLQDMLDDNNERLNERMTKLKERINK